MSEPDGLTAAQTEVVELRALFDVQWRRMRDATERWQKAHPEIKDVELIWPDLGDMLYWLLERNTTIETKLKALVVHEEALREWWALWDNDGPGSGTHRDGPLNSIPGDVRERHDRLLAIEAEARVAGAAEVAGLDAAVAAIKAARARWLEKPRTPVIEGVDIGIELALSLLLIERDRARWDAEIGRLTGGPT